MGEIKDIIRRDYTEISKYYDYDRYEDPRHPANLRLKEIIEEVLGRYLVGNTVFELAAGTGYWGRYLIDKGYEYSGVDLTEAMVDKAKEKGIETIKIGDVEDIEIYPDGVDNIVSIKSFTFFQKPLQVLHNVKASLKEGGRFIVFYNNKYNLPLMVYSIFADGNKVAPFPPHEHRYSWKEFSGMLEKVGLRKIHIRDCVNLPYRFIPPMLRSKARWIDDHLRMGWTTCIVAEK